MTGLWAAEAGRTAAMWTQENRARYDRSKLRYPSDLTDEEWGKRPASAAFPDR
ncbi:hypothetical protein ACFQU2_42445 [Siccirubricoccus deserti]